MIAKILNFFVEMVVVVIGYMVLGVKALGKIVLDKLVQAKQATPGTINSIKSTATDARTKVSTNFPTQERIIRGWVGLNKEDAA